MPDVGRPGGYYEESARIPVNNPYEDQLRYSNALEPLFERTGLTAEGVDRLRSYLASDGRSLNTLSVEASQDPEGILGYLNYLIEREGWGEMYAVAEDGSDAYVYQEPGPESVVKDPLFPKTRKIGGGRWGR